MQQAQIRRDFVASLQQDDIAGYQFFAGDAQAFAGTYHRCTGRQHVADGIHGLFGLAFLDIANDRIGHHDSENDHRVPQVLQRCGDCSGTEQHINQDVMKLQQKSPPRWPPG